MIAPMTDHRPRSSYESDRLPYTKRAAWNVVRTTIGKELPTRCEILQELPSGMLALLMKLNEREEE
jgi:hypothetical protein